MFWYTSPSHSSKLIFCPKGSPPRLLLLQEFFCQFWLSLGWHDTKCTVIWEIMTDQTKIHIIYKLQIKKKKIHILAPESSVGRAPDEGFRGPGFESGLVRHFFSKSVPPVNYDSAWGPCKSTEIMTCSTIKLNFLKICCLNSHFSNSF